MKLIKFSIFTFLLTSSIISAQEVKNDIYDTITANEFGSANDVIVKNINGFLEVEGHDGEDILITGERELWKESGTISSAEAEEYELKWMVKDGFVFIYVDAPGVEIDFNEQRINYNMSWNDRGRNKVKFNFDLKVKIPKSMNIDASTINGGRLLVEKMDAAIAANNVNGSVKVMNAKAATDVNTVNGNIEVWFAQSPTTDMDFNTVNGTIDIYSPKDFGAIVTFESLHGDLYTDFENVKRLPNQLNRANNTRDSRYKISSNTPIQIGNGGPEMNFKLVNGSVYIRERES